MDDVLLTAIARAAGTRIALSNGWRYGAPIPPGRVTAHDLLCMVPMNPPIRTVELTGAEVLAIMEYSLESTFSADAFRQRGGYVKRFRGLVFNVKLENLHGARIEAACRTEGDLPIDDRTYRAAYITEQGVPGTYGSGRKTLSVHTIAACGTGSPPPIGTATTSAACGFAEGARSRHLAAGGRSAQQSARAGHSRRLTRGHAAIALLKSRQRLWPAGRVPDPRYQ